MLKRRAEVYNVVTGRFDALADEQLAAFKLAPRTTASPMASPPIEDMRSFMSFALKELQEAHYSAAPPLFTRSANEAAMLPSNESGIEDIEGFIPAATLQASPRFPDSPGGAAEEPTGLPLPVVGSFSPAEVNNGHLHYGGSLSAKTKALGSKPESGRAFRVQKRLELMVRMENAAIPDAAAAQMLSVTLNYYKTIKKSAAYLRARTQITLGLVVDQSASLAAIREQRKEMLTQMLPQALQVIANAVHRPAHSIAEQKLQVAVAQDLLDREGTFAKISRAEIRPVDSFDWSTVDERGRSIVEVIRGAAMLSRSRSIEVQDTIELSQAFSHGRTLDPKEQQSALDDLEKTLLQAVPSASEKLQ